MIRNFNYGSPGIDSIESPGEISPPIKEINGVTVSPYFQKNSDADFGKVVNGLESESSNDLFFDMIN